MQLLDRLEGNSLFIAEDQIQHIQELLEHEINMVEANKKLPAYIVVRSILDCKELLKIPTGKPAEPILKSSLARIRVATKPSLCISDLNNRSISEFSDSVASSQKVKMHDICETCIDEELGEEPGEPKKGSTDLMQQNLAKHKKGHFQDR